MVVVQKDKVFLTLALYESELSSLHLATLPLWKKPGDRRLGMPQSWSAHCSKDTNLSVLLFLFSPYIKQVVLHDFVQELC
jgi:hypothetical protein